MLGERIILLVLATTFALISWGTARADSWSFPTQPYERHSDDGRHVLRIIPADDDENGKTGIEMLRKQQEGHELIWSCDLSDAHLPYDVRFAPGGRAVVLLDHIGGVGWGEVVTICDKRGVLATYTLEQVLGLRKGELYRLPLKGSVWNPFFSESTMSRWWREHAMHLFDQVDGGPCFCIWLPYDPGWVVFDLATGRMIKPTIDQTARWNKRLRDRAVKTLAETSGDYVDYRFNRENAGPIAAIRLLASLHDPADHPILENLLAYPWFSTGKSTTSGTASEAVRQAFYFYSAIRQAAVAARAFSKGSQDHTKPRHDEHSPWHGSIEGRVELPVAPRSTDGYLDLYLVPHTVGRDEVDGRNVTHCARIDFTSWVRDEPSDYDWNPVKHVPVQWTMVLPGRYWLKAVWDRTPRENDPFDPTVNIIGDFHTVEIKTFEVEAGHETDIGVVPCKSVIEPAQEAGSELSHTTK